MAMWREALMTRVMLGPPVVVFESLTATVGRREYSISAPVKGRA